jgi:hypothetical protein
LVDKLIQRERRQFEPTAPARVPFSATEAMAVMMLTGVYAVVTHATGMNLRILEWLARHDPGEMAFYAAVGILCGSVSLWFWRQRRRDTMRKQRAGIGANTSA